MITVWDSITTKLNSPVDVPIGKEKTRTKIFGMCIYVCIENTRCADLQYFCLSTYSD